MSANSELDIRWPIGLLFAALGALLALYGAVSGERTVFHPETGAEHVLNLNLWWGLAMLAFGVFMIVGAMRRSASGEEKEERGRGSGV